MNPIITCLFSANQLSKSNMNWQFYMVSLMLCLFQLMHPLNGGVGREIHGELLLLLLSYGVHGGGGIT